MQRFTQFLTEELILESTAEELMEKLNLCLDIKLNIEDFKILS